MDVKTKLYIQLGVLSVIIILLSWFVYYVSTNDPISEKNNEFREIILDNKRFENNNANNEELLNEEDVDVVGVVKINESITPSSEIKNIYRENNQIIYRVEMNATWNNNLHKGFYPKGAHLSPFVAYTHSKKDVLFSINGVSSVGIKDVAETGSTRAIERIIKSYQTNNLIGSYGIGKRIDAPAIDEKEVSVKSSFPYISIISMIAPSPDWFVAASNVLLFEGGRWKEKVEVDAIILDAGTDSGRLFESKNRKTTPFSKIKLLDSKETDLNVPTLPIVRFTFERI